VREDIASYRSSEPALLIGNSGKARDTLGWAPQVGFRELVTMMVEADLRAITNQGGVE
jgi:GDPmannose 4,6-dehydratase